MKDAVWQLWIDTGGTFTDCLATAPSGDIRRLKILSSSVLRGTVIRRETNRTLKVSMAWPTRQDIYAGFEFRLIGSTFRCSIKSVDLQEGILELDTPLPKKLSKGFEITSREEVPVLAARLLTETPLTEAFPRIEMKLGSTRGTNALLERKGARTALLVTQGFRDLLTIGTQQRPDLFTLQVRKTIPLYDVVIPVAERIDAHGHVLLSLTRETIKTLVRQLKKNKVESVAVALLNSYRNPVHERMLAEALQEAGMAYVSLSTALSQQIKLVPRAETTVANAYLDPTIRNYVAGIRSGLSLAQLSIMTSAGSLVRSDSFFPKDSLLSGPAGGVVGAAHQAIQSGIRRMIAFDMGGTSTDVSLYNDRFDYRFESRVGNFSILSPSLAIETIAAGGGSICDFDGHRLTVGPHSAGANPGPACYGAGGPLTITDVNLLLGRLDPDYFVIPIQKEYANQALDRLLSRVQKKTGRAPGRMRVLESFIQIANEKMADAIKKISVQQGHDPHDFALLSFGGAGGQHACALAAMAGIKKVLVPYDAGLLSAYGMGQAAIERFEEQLVLQPWSLFSARLDDTLQQLAESARHRLVQDDLSHNAIQWKKSLLFLRFYGQETAIEIEYQTGDRVLDSFRKKYVAIYGHWIDREIEVESVKVIVSAEPAPVIKQSLRINPYKPTPSKEGQVFTHGKKVKSHIYQWEQLAPGARIDGPALVISGNSTTFIDEGWRWTLDAYNHALLVRHSSAVRADTGSRHSQEALLELYTNRFTALAQEMGALLQRTSFSVNVKERLDFSCALLDPRGYLVVNAPHIPVHLGSLGVCVREVGKVLTWRPGDVVITNHPAFGGSHLPDVTLIKPVFHRKQLVGFVANRAHHAEIGGKKPGSMPADARYLEEEGVVIAPTYLVKAGKPQWQSIQNLLLKARYPTRSLSENLADLNGALAAVQLGDQGLLALCEQYGAVTIQKQMTALRQHAAGSLRETIRALRKKQYAALERLDDGSILQVGILRQEDSLIIDFSGSSKIHPGNLNATKAIVQSVVLYSLRLLVNKPLPMNEGLMDPVKLILPHGLLNPDWSSADPDRLPAVVGGNTEVSQRLTDTMLKAFGLAACSQGTMNNVLFGNSSFGYYETICGGTGAGPGFNGTDAVHQHMTNTRITDPEVMEFRYPVLLNRFEIRKDSGGRGLYHGGNGIVREIEFKEDLEINLLTQHRVERPYGMYGGGAGKSGEQWLQRSGGKIRLKGMDSASVKAGDRLIILTPGGGGWGR
jgi:5-oxoprolinase (ATP-hydrolysing)